MELTPPQTIGPFFHLCLTAKGAVGTMPNVDGERVRLVFRLFDGDGVPVTDAMVEVWQADADGQYRSGFGRLATDETGACAFDGVKPGRVPGPNGRPQAPHVNVSIFARGLLKRVVTRLYFAGDPGNGEDPILALVSEERRGTLLATQSEGQWILDVHLSGERETVFFDV